MTVELYRSDLDKQWRVHFKSKGRITFVLSEGETSKRDALSVLRNHVRAIQDGKLVFPSMAPKDYAFLNMSYTQRRK